MRWAVFVDIYALQSFFLAGSKPSMRVLCVLVRNPVQHGYSCHFDSILSCGFRAIALPPPRLPAIRKDEDMRRR